MKRRSFIARSLGAAAAFFGLGALPKVKAKDERDDPLPAGDGPLYVVGQRLSEQNFDHYMGLPICVVLFDCYVPHHVFWRDWPDDRNEHMKCFIGCLFGDPRDKWRPKREPYAGFSPPPEVERALRRLTS